jgi:hypothetical protein
VISEIPGGVIVTEPDTTTPPALARTLTVVRSGTALVEQLNATLDDPPGTSTEWGTSSAVELALRLTLIPPDGAFPVSLTVTVVWLPPDTLFGLKLSAVSFGACIVSFAEAMLPSRLAVMVAACVAGTGDVETVKLAVDSPMATVTSAGTEADRLEDFTATVLPPVPAFLVRTTVPEQEDPPRIEGGSRKTRVTS